MLDAAITGPALIRAGLKRLWHPSLRWLVLAPLVINLAVYAVLIGVSVQWLSGWLDSLMSTVPDWLQAVVWLIWLLFAVMAMVVTAFTFNLLANLLGSPFYGLIAERVLAQERGGSADLATVSMGRVAWQSFLRQLQFLRYLLAAIFGDRTVDPHRQLYSCCEFARARDRWALGCLVFGAAISGLSSR
jgi:CysZ protein